MTEPGRKATTAKGSPPFLLSQESMGAQGGFTLIELTVASVAASILILAVAMVLANFQKGWNQSYERVYGDVVSDGYVARRVFDRIVRKATIRKCIVGTANEYAEVYYYSSMQLDRYATFFCQDGNLKLEIGWLVEGTFDHDANKGSTTRVLARNVTACSFTQEGICLSMILTLDDGSTSNTITVTATRHNDY